MDGNSLKRDQIIRIRGALYPCLNYLSRLRQRMDQVGFISADPLYQLVARAYDAVHALYIDLHYRSCESGVGRSPSKS